MSITVDKESICSLCSCHIGKNTLFTGLNTRQLDAFKDVVSISAFKKREVVFMEGDECTGLYIIRTGRVKVVRSSHAGKEQIIKILKPGDMLGFEALYDGRTYRNTAMAMDDCELCYMEKNSFFSILVKEPDISRKLIISMGRELDQAYDRIGSLGLLNAREKLAHLLYTLASEYGTRCDRVVKLNLTLSRLEIAELLGITQETSIRLLKSFKDEGILDIKRKEIVIKSLDRLKMMGQ